MKFIIDSINKILNRSTAFQRRILLIFFDSFIILNIAQTQNITNISPLKQEIELFLLFFIFIIIYITTGQYKGITKFEGTSSIYKISLRIVISLSIYFLIIKLLFGVSISLENLLICWSLITTITIIYRLIFRDILINLNKSRNYKTSNCIVFGAGYSGAQLAKYMELNMNYKIISFIDDNPKLWGRKIDDIKISSPKYIKKFSYKVDKLFIAIRDLSKKRKKEVFKICKSLDIEVLQVVSVKDITSSSKNLLKIKPIKIEDLLGREVAPITKILKKSKIKDSTVCVTGAGGSIGSELCHQIIKLKPKELIIIDNCEHKLFQIKRKLEELKGIKFVFFLGDVTRKSFVKRIFEVNKIDIVFHAAAYKHVPIVELNPLQGIFNNVFSTLEICKFAEINNVGQILLISTDKAVRPTNVMGASKRLAELIIQAFAEKNNSTIYSMVRFGNVLGSSGSVVPIFQNQINSGGPITVTHPNVIRYFMTISEAVQLVIQAIELAKGGDVFLLDMGDPVPIKDLASQMIYLSGLKPKSEKEPDGDIEIEYTGLRPGEKLYEELLINAESSPTENQYIYKANENHVAYDNLMPLINDLEKYIENNKTEKVFNLLSKLVPEWDKNI